MSEKRWFTSVGAAGVPQSAKRVSVTSGAAWANAAPAQDTASARVDIGASDIDGATLSYGATGNVLIERAALTSVTQVIVTSAQTADILARDYDVPCERIVVARPGCVAAPLARGSDDGIVHLLAVGAVSPRKGYGVLLDALARLRDLPWRLTIAGAPDRNADEAARLDMFERINTGSKNANNAEIRRGALAGPFLDVVMELANLPLLASLAPMPAKAKKERGYEELVTRFFAYGDGLEDYRDRPSDFLFVYSKKMNEAFAADPALADAYRGRFNTVLEFVSRNFPIGFRSIFRTEGAFPLFWSASEPRREKRRFVWI